MSKRSTPLDSLQRVCGGGSRQDTMIGMDLRERSEKLIVLVADAVSSRYRGEDIRSFQYRIEIEHVWWQIFQVRRICLFVFRFLLKNKLLNKAQKGT